MSLNINVPSAGLQIISGRASRVLPDADDDMVMELALASGCRHIITHNGKDFHRSEQHDRLD
jgi:hypothetical protein